MNLFKKIYKEINDSIPVNEELLKSLLVQTEKPAKIVRFKNIYKYSMVAVAALALTISAIALPKFLKDEPQVQKAQDNVALASSKLSEEQEIQHKEKQTAFEENQNSSTTTSDSSQKIQANTKSTKIQAEILPSAVSEDTVESFEEDYDEAPAVAISAETSEVDLRAGGTSQNYTMNIDEYIGKFGFNLSHIVLPSGVERLNDTVPAHYDDEGNLTFYECVVAYSNREKAVNITVTSNREYISEMLTLYPQNRVYGNDGYIGAYVLNENGGYAVDCYGFTEDEVEALVSSIK